MTIMSLVAKLVLDKQEFEKGLQESETQAESFGTRTKKAFGTVAKGVAAAGAVVVSTGAAMYKMASSAAATTDRVDKMSQKIGISRTAYQELNFILSQSGTSVDMLQAGMKSLTAAMDGAKSGTAANVEQFQRLGVAVTNADGTFRSQEDVMFDVIAALQGMSDQTEKARLASELFGRSGTELMPLLNGAAGSIEEMREQAHRLGLVLDDEAIDAGVHLTDTIDQVKRSFSAIVTQINLRVMPIVQKALDWIIDHMPEIQTGMQKVYDIMSEIGKGVESVWKSTLKPILGALVDFITGFVIPNFETLSKVALAALAAFVAYKTISSIVSVIQAVTTVVKGLSAAQGVLNAVMAANPFTIVVVAITALIAAFVTLYATNENFRKAVQEAWEAIKSVIKGVIDFIVDYYKFLWETLKAIFKNAPKFFKDIFTKAKDAVVNAWKSVTDFFKGIWDKIKSTFNSVREWFKQKFDGAKDAIKGAFSSIGEWAKGVWDKITAPFKKAVEWFKEKFAAVRDAIKNTFGSIKDWFKNLWDKVKSFFKLPHFKITGSLNPLDWFSGRFPKISVDWYKKAYDNPIMFTRPTIIPTASGLKGFGDGAGGEVVLSADRLRQMTGGNFTFNIYAQPGQDEEAIARAVQRQFVRWENQRKAAFV